MTQKIPKIWLAYSRLLIKLYLPKFSEEDYLKFSKSKKVREINRFIEINGDNLLKNISKLSGIPWFRKEIPIYLVPNGNLKSFAYPLVLNLKDRDLEIELLVLTHELCHVNSIRDGDKLFYQSYFQGVERWEIISNELFCWLIAKLALQKTVKDWARYEKSWNKILMWQGMEKTKQEIEKLEKEWNYNKMNFLTHYKKSTKK